MFKIANEKKNVEDIELKCVANKIKTEIKQASMLKNIDPVLSQDNLSEVFIPIIENLLVLISPRLVNSNLTC